MNDPLYPHQEKALRQLSNGKILHGGVGSGKTRVAVEYYLLREAPREVIVITTAKKRDDFDWQEEFYKHGLGPSTGPVAYGVQKSSRRKAGGSGAELGRDIVPYDSGTGAQVSELPPGSQDSSVGTRDAHTRRGSRPSLAPGLLLQGDQRGGVTPAPEALMVGRSLDGLAGSGGALHRGSSGTAGAQGSTSTDRDLHAEASGSHRSGNSSSASSAVSQSSAVSPSGLDGVGQAGIYPWVVTVDSWNNIAKYADKAGAFFIFDEQRLVGAGDWSRKFLRIAKRNRWILLTATPGDTWLDYVPVFIANGFYKNRTQFKHEHVIYSAYTKFPKVERYINVGTLYKHRQSLLVSMPFERHTKRRYVETPLPYDKETLNRVIKDRWNVYEDRPLRDVAEMCTVSRRVVNSDPSRLEMVCELWKLHPKLIVFYNYNFELESLRSLKDYYGLLSPGIGTSTRTAGRGSGSSTSTSVSTDGTKSRESSSSTSSRPTNTASSRAPRGMSTSTGSSVTSSSSSTVESARLSDRTDGWSARAALAELRARWRIESSNFSKNSSQSAGLKRVSASLSDVSTTKKYNDSGKKQSAEEVIAGRLLGSSTTPTLSGTSKVGRSLSLEEDPTTSGGSNPQTSFSTRQPEVLGGMSDSVAIAEWNGHKHEPIPTTDRWLYLVQYTAGAEGWNCIETDAMIMYSANYSWKVTEQAYGRIDRLNSPFIDLWYYRFQSSSWIDQAIEKALRAKENFNEARYSGMFKGR